MTWLANAAEKGLAEKKSLSPGLSPVRIWLFAIAVLVFAMVVVGGATRLTGSGLSITEWQPVLGVVPPVSEAGWQAAFEKYRQIPEYSQINPGMTLDGFKAIYWWEWTHRLLGRLIGFVFFIPFVVFLARGTIPRAFRPRAAALFLLGAGQGALGWFMVKSGLADRVDVSQYRLAAHLALAVAIGAYAFWLALSIGQSAETGRKTLLRRSSLPVRLAAGILAGLVYLQIVGGAFVAGLKAGHASSTWPLMNGEIIPPGLDVFSPWYLNLFENPLAAQFAHRLLAYVIAIFAAGLAVFVWRSSLPQRRTPSPQPSPRGRGSSAAPVAASFPLAEGEGQGEGFEPPGGDKALRLPVLATNAAILAQIALGVATVVYGVPLALALAHQANAILLFALSLWTLHRASVPLEFSPKESLAPAARPQTAG